MVRWARRLGGFYGWGLWRKPRIILWFSFCWLTLLLFAALLRNNETIPRFSRLVALKRGPYNSSTIVGGRARVSRASTGPWLPLAWLGRGGTACKGGGLRRVR